MEMLFLFVYPLICFSINTSFSVPRGDCPAPPPTPPLSPSLSLCPLPIQVELVRLKAGPSSSATSSTLAELQRQHEEHLKLVEASRLELAAFLRAHGLADRAAALADFGVGALLALSPPPPLLCFTSHGNTV